MSEAKGVVTVLTLETPDNPTRKVHLRFATQVSARYVRLTVLAWHGAISLRAGLLQPKLQPLQAQISRDFDYFYLSLSAGLAMPEKTSWLNQDSNYK